MRNLSAVEKSLLYKLTVRTSKLKEDEQNPDKKIEYCLGSGTIIASGTDCFVMTAGHCVDGVDIEHIKVEWFNGRVFNRIAVREKVCCKYDETTGEDYAVIRIDSPTDEVDYTQIIKRFDLAIEEDNYFMLAYPPNARIGRLFERNCIKRYPIYIQSSCQRKILCFAKYQMSIAWCDSNFCTRYRILYRGWQIACKHN